MKLHYYLMSVALMATATVSFTACDDDDVKDEPVYVIGGQNGGSDIQFSSDVVRVKIGEANRVGLPIASATGDIKAFSLNPDVAEVVMVDGVPMIEGFKNGTCGVMVSDANGNYKELQVSVYTTDVMEVSHSDFTFEVPLGGSATTEEASVTLGNGGYTISSDNPAVTATIDEETGAIAITATSKVNPYTAVLTVKDTSGLTANINVTVQASLQPFTPEQIQEILAKTKSTIWADCKDPSDGNVPYYFNWYESYGKWYDSAENGTMTAGWWCVLYGYDYGGIKIEYPENTAVNTEVDGKLYYQYSNKQWYDCYEYDVKVTVLENSATRLVVIANQVDLENERLNRGYVVIVK